MKKIIVPSICILILIILLINLNNIASSLTKYIVTTEPNIPSNSSVYKKNYSLSYVEETSSFIPYSKQDLMNIFYTSINNGWNNFTFYCPSEYSDCVSDMSEISQDNTILTHINNFVHPYNSFTNVTTTMSDSGEINLEINYLYSQTDINKIDEKVDNLIIELLSDEMDIETKIKTIHDYIINNAQYDVATNKNEETIYKSSIAYGPLFQGYAICNGYTDLMAIFLIKLDIKNIKVATTPDEISYSNTGHVWNAVYLEDEWLHIDLTWDDPVTENGTHHLFHTYFLITTNELNKEDDKETKLEEHQFNKSIYYELK